MKIIDNIKMLQILNIGRKQMKNQWQKVLDEDTRKLFQEICKWNVNKFIPTVLDSVIQYKDGRKAQLQWDKTKSTFGRGFRKCFFIL